MIHLGRRHVAAAAAALLLSAGGWAALPLVSASGASSIGSSATTAPVHAVETISGSFFTFRYDKSVVAMAKGGTLKVVNNTGAAHTLTSNARSSTGAPLFNVFVPANSSRMVPNVGKLAPGNYGFHCNIHPNMKATLSVKGSGGGTGGTGTHFLQPLKLPRVLTGAHITLPIKRADVRVLPTGPLTQMWTYGGSYPGPVIRRPAGQDTKVTFVDQLPARAGSFTVHFHGDHHASVNDGQPMTQLIRSGTSRTYDYPLTDNGLPERAAFNFYHDHRMGLTSRNNWRGLQGMFIIDDPVEQSLPLPKGKYDIPLMVSDRSFTSSNQLTNPFLHPAAAPNDATVGNDILVDGRYAPYFNVGTHRYRLRLLNASNFTSYNFALSDGRSFVQVGTGNGLLPHPVVRKTILLGPAQRADVIVNFGGEFGKRVVLQSVPRAGTLRPGSVQSRSAPIMQFRVVNRVADGTHIPPDLQAPPPLPLPATPRVAFTWTVGLNTATHQWTINGRSFNRFPNYVPHKVQKGAIQEWRIVNKTRITHYIHLHEEQWHTVSRDGHAPPPWERGLEDTWKLDPGESVIVAARFSDYVGKFMIHCHMLDHEDHGLMSQFEVVPAGSPTAVGQAGSGTPGAAAAAGRNAGSGMSDMPGMAAQADSAASAVGADRLSDPGTSAGIGGSPAWAAGSQSFLPRFGRALIGEAALAVLLLLAWMVVVRYRRWVDRLA